MLTSKQVLKHINKQDKIYKKWIKEIESVLFQRFYELFGNKYNKEDMWVEINEITFDYFFVFAEGDQKPFITFKINYGIWDKINPNEEFRDVIFQDTAEVFSPSCDQINFYEDISKDFIDTIKIHL